MPLRGQKSLLLITVDCLRADHVGFLGYDRATTPFLDLLAKESLVVPAAIVAGAPTYYSVPSILAARYPLDLGRDCLGIAPGETTLASVLREAGYASAAFSAGNPYVSRRFGYDEGFDVFQDFLSADESPVAQTATARNGSWLTRVNRGMASVSHYLGPLGSVYDELYFQYCQRRATAPEKSLDALRRFPAADVIVDVAMKWLASVGDQPFFLWLHFMDPHSPYYPADPALDAIAPGKWTPFRARYVNSFWNRGDVGVGRFVRHRDGIIELYDAGIRWVDTQIARLVEGLKQSKKWERCALALTADHGEEFLDHGGRYHAPTDLREELVHVPLLLRIPGFPSREQSGAPFGLVHLAPTLLGALDVPAPETFRGRNLWAQLQAGGEWEFTAIAECVTGCTNPFLRENRIGPRVLAVREARYKMILRFDSPGELLFDLQADSREQAPLPPAAEKAVRRRLLEAAREHLARSAQQRNSEARVRSCLRDLQLEWAVPPARPSAS
jgi:arylsulfatase A-like enzyme